MNRLEFVLTFLCGISGGIAFSFGHTLVGWYAIGAMVALGACLYGWMSYYPKWKIVSRETK